MRQIQSMFKIVEQNWMVFDNCVPNKRR